MRQHSVATLAGAPLDYWVACAVGKRRPVIVEEKGASPECLVEVDGTQFEPFSPLFDVTLAEALLSASTVRVLRICTPDGPAWAAFTSSGIRFISASWHVAGLRALVAGRFGHFVFDDVEESS